jgi:hypothetical protein
MILLYKSDVDIECLIWEWRDWSKRATSCFPELWHASLWDYLANNGMRFNKDFDNDDLNAIEDLAKRGGMLAQGSNGILEWQDPDTKRINKEV